MSSSLQQRFPPSARARAPGESRQEAGGRREVRSGPVPSRSVPASALTLTTPQGETGPGR